MLDITMTPQGKNAELKLIGRLDTNTSKEAAPAFEEAAARYERVFLNLEGLDYLSSPGLRLLKRMHTAMNCKGGAMIVRNVKPEVMDIFDVTGFALLLTFESAEE